MGLRLWAADALGFAMAPTALPLALLHKQPTAAPGAALREAAPFVANLYIKVGYGWVLGVRLCSSLRGQLVKAGPAREQCGNGQTVQHW